MPLRIAIIMATHEPDTWQRKTKRLSLQGSRPSARKVRLPEIRTKGRFLDPTTDKSWQSPLLGRKAQPIRETLAQRWGFYKYSPSLEGQVLNSHSILSLFCTCALSDLSIGAPAGTTPPPPLVIAAFCSPQPFNSTKDSSSEGLAGPQPFLINRWLATLQRHCESRAILMSAVLSADPEVVCPIGKRIMSKLARQMSDYLWSGICPSSDSDWDILLTTDMGNSDLKITSQEIQDAYGANPSIILSASTSVWMPVSRQRVFDFLRDARRRSEWDVLSNGVSMEEMVRVATGEGIGNSVSILRGHNAANGIYLQDSWTDSSCSMVVYSPISMQSLDMLMDGGDSSFVALFPSGFSILPDGYSNSNTGTSSDDSGSSDNDNSGCLLTVGFQMLLTNESFDTIYELMSHTIEKIKDALEVE
ncbi:hypothetical protein QL285_031724 [Trifolium repens]|nr:hypothetical protein QL285_031724 [Trifolium repens]